MKYFVAILAVVACAAAGNVNREKRSGWGDYSYGGSLYSHGIGYAAPAAKVVTVNKVVNTERVIDVPQVVNVRKVIHEPRVITVNKVVPAPSYFSSGYGSNYGYGSSFGHGYGSSYGYGAANNGWW